MNTRNKFIGGIVAGAAALVLSACLLPTGDGEGLNANGDVPPNVETLGTIQAMLQSQSCNNCHGAGATAGLNISSFQAAFNSFFVITNGDTVPRAATTTAGSGKLRINPDNVDASHLLERINSTGSIKMPPSGPALSDEDKARIRSWIAAGAPIYATTPTP